MSQPPVQYHLGQFPPETLDWPRLIPLIGPANAGLARYDGLLSAIPNADVLLSPLTTQEAVLSSKIEGTHVTIGEVLEFKVGFESAALTQPKRDDAEEVLNYRKAMQACVAEMEHRPLSQHLLRAAHSMVMQGVRGRDKSPESYRTNQNWIGPKGCTIEEASFIPVSPEHLQHGMDVWESYLKTTSEPDALVQLAILHVEFEALHPFNDGDWTRWCEFFLQGICHQAAENEYKARAILALYDHVKKQVADLVHSQHSMRAVDFIFQEPVFSAPAFIQSSEIPKPSANRILSLLRENKLLFTLREGKGRRPGVYAFLELLGIAEGKKVV